MIKDIIIPQEWSDVTLKEFILLSELNIKNYKNEIDYYLNILEIFGNDLNDIKNYINIMDISNIISEMTFLKEMPQGDKLNSVVIDEVEYILQKDFNKLNVGEYISIETMIEKDKLNNISSIPVILSVVLKPKDEKFNADIMKTRSEMFKNKLNIEQVIDMGIFFSNGGK